MDVRSAREIGAVIRGARCYLRLTQAEVGRACGYSASSVSRIESGHMHLGYVELVKIAAFLDLTLDRLGISPVPGMPPVDTVERPADEEDAVRRRNLLTGALAAGATAVVGSTPAGAASPLLEQALFRLPDALPVPLKRLIHQTAKARADFRAARYSSLGQVLPGLLAAASATRDTSTGHQRDQVNAVLSRAYVLAAELALKQHNDVAWVAADRALTAARESGHPVPVGESARVLAITMRRSGQCSAAVRFLTQEATGLDAGQAQTGAVRTTLMLTASYTAATGGDRTTALDLLDEAAEETKRRRAVTGLFTVEATQNQVDGYRISVFNVLGTPDEGVPVASQLAIDRLPSPERRARTWTDTARMWHALGNGPQTLAALRRVEQEAPQEAQRPAIRALTSELLYTSPRVPGIREFAARTGATSAAPSGLLS
ncbi:helix-turn-helix domain-containing protein [Streptomyces triculaminicus]|uniref:helix-turn-helix domain-containing protein n=1 Tax=Streptomyces triculaminicus TaxID=2816232 RepID=UPI0037A20B76